MTLSIACKDVSNLTKPNFNYKRNDFCSGGASENYASDVRLIC
jgi:hypothetical protein